MEPRPDQDGDGTRCGLPWEPAGETTHECPAGFVDGPDDDPREAIYDAEIAPLMAQIIALCKQHGIPVVASFQLTRTLTPEEEKDGEVTLFCTTAIVKQDSDRRFKDVVHVLYDGWQATPQVQAFAITTTVRRADDAG